MEIIITPKLAKLNIKKLLCEICNYKCIKESDMNKHFLTAKHINCELETAQKNINAPIIASKNNKKFNCKKCDFKCNKKSDYKRHLVSLKHQNDIKDNESNETEIDLNCIRCNKVYKTNSGLWKHHKSCTFDINAIPENVIVSDSSNNDIIHLLVKENSDFKGMLMEMMKSNTDLQKQMLEMCKNNNNSNNTTINNTNNTLNDSSKTFNLQVFLNEKCKDAMNLDDFANSIQLKLSDLIRIGEEGYIPGMSKVIIERLLEVELCKRPIHCSDEKREAIQVKMADKWKREAIDSVNLTNAVRIIEKKQFDMLTTFRETYPECVNSDSHHNDMLIKLFQNLSNSREPEFIKVMKKVAKAVVINKEENA